MIVKSLEIGTVLPNVVWDTQYILKQALLILKRPQRYLHVLITIRALLHLKAINMTSNLSKGNGKAIQNTQCSQKQARLVPKRPRRYLHVLITIRTLLHLWAKGDPSRVLPAALRLHVFLMVKRRRPGQMKRPKKMNWVMENKRRIAATMLNLTRMELAEEILESLGKVKGDARCTELSIVERLVMFFLCLPFRFTIVDGHPRQSFMSYKDIVL